jgi:hypothetical protein
MKEEKDWISIVRKDVRQDVSQDFPKNLPAKKHSLMPLLTVVFIASYGLMTLLIVEQGATIQSQRNLIQMLQGDSTQFWAQQGKALHDKQVTQSQLELKNPSTHGQTPSTQTPLPQTPSSQVQSNKVQSNNPSTQAVPQHRSQTKAGKSAKPHMQLPPMPASDLGDQRRELITL